MRKILVILAICMGLVLAGLLQGFFNIQTKTAKAEGIVIYVSANDPICGEHLPCFSSIQDAVSVAISGDKIFVAGGIYTGTDVAAIGYLAGITESITIQGGYDEFFTPNPDPITNPTIFDAQDLGRVIHVSGDITATIAGINLTGGNASGLGGGHPSSVGDDPDAGGGIYLDDTNAILQNVQVFSNTARQGGGIFQNKGIAAFQHVEIFSNTAIVDEVPKGSLGGGVFLNRSQATFENCTISNNHAVISGTAQWSSGGGFYLFVSDVHFNNNTITDNSAVQPGGGLLIQSSNVSFVNNLVNNNVSIYSNGGGIDVGHSDIYMKNNTITGNTTRYYGGGLTIQNCDQAELIGNIIRGNTSTQRNGGGLMLRMSTVTMTNNIISDNQAWGKGSGILVEGADVNMVHNTISSNTGGDGIGVYVNHYKYASSPTLYPSDVNIVNTILVSHTIGISVTSINTATIDGILWYNTLTNTEKSITATLTIQNQHTGNPIFALDGYHITDGSAAIDQGVPSNVHLDIDNEPRFSPSDLGVDEYWAPGALKRIFLPLVFK